MSITSSVNTSPFSKNSLSSFNAESASSKDPGAEGMLASSSGGSPYMSLSNGSPGSSLFYMPSITAINIAENARYPLQEGSGVLNSIRLALGDAEYIGILIAALRLRLEYARLTGASNPGTSLL